MPRQTNELTRDPVGNLPPELARGFLTAGVTDRLAGEFGILSRDTVERSVTDAWCCAEHLGLEVTPALVERIAREHLVGVVNSVPPSGPWF
ncbi:MAG: hypothetical protein GEV11_03230 [Streptosporangiales bacterium]|nr:hypothetical protein [Streptosporangiales bacterium]